MSERFDGFFEIDVIIIIYVYCYTDIIKVRYNIFFVGSVLPNSKRKRKKWYT